MSHRMAQSVAPSGIAATLFDKGHTTHLALKLPLDLNLAEHPICTVRKSFGMASVLKTSQLIIWNECTMTHKKGFEALDLTLRDF